MSDPLAGCFRSDGLRFRLYESDQVPAWRRPQRGALGALLAHWSLPRTVPALLSMPTGTGKSAVAAAAPFLAAASRVLLVVPSVELRKQLTGVLSRLDVLRRIGAVAGDGAPNVVELVSRVDRWEELERADVVVALPVAISPAHYGTNPPPQDLFDLVIIDEAHHAPAPTWRAILDHFAHARAVLLTATPRRRDGQRLPGEHIYHYPLRQALEERIFKPVTPLVLDVPDGSGRDSFDGAILDAVVEVLNQVEHTTSTLLVRASTRDRAKDLACRYTDAGIAIEVLHSGLGIATQRRIVESLRSGDLRAVSVVGMLIEGFDLPSLRVVAYHDKHKSLPATAQLVGRLARVDDRYPQASMLVTARDIDVFPELQGLVRTLYAEDSDWATVLPGIIDEEIEVDLGNRDYARRFTAAPAELALDAVQPLRRATIFEMTDRAPGELKTFDDGTIPENLAEGKLLNGRIILYSGLNPEATTLMIVTEAVNRPRWHNAPGLDTPEYQLHLVSRRQAPRTDLPDLLLVNSYDQATARQLLDAVNTNGRRIPADPTRLHQAFDSLERVSVSSVGLRNSYGGGRGVANYRMFAGKSVDRGLREADTAFGSLGHAMIQVAGDTGTFTAGVATGKGKYWETRYSPLRVYEAFMDDLAERYWFPPQATAGQLLPQVSRGRRLEVWPDALPVAVEADPAIVGMGWTLDGIGPLDDLDFEATPAETERLPLLATIVDNGSRRVIWRGWQDITGVITADGHDPHVYRGFGTAGTLSQLLTDRPPTIFFSNGVTVHGPIVVDSRVPNRALPATNFEPADWPGVDLGAETPRSAEKRQKGVSIHEEFERYLVRQPLKGRHRWVIHNDGRGEIADYIVVEVDHGLVYVGLWHAKAAGGDTAAVRVGDLQEVIAQAIKSRRWITDPGLWNELGARLTGKASPPATVVDGRSQQLLVLCGQYGRAEKLAFTRTRPIVRGEIVIVQPGLSLGQLSAQLAGQAQLSAIQSRDLLAVFHDSVSQVATSRVLCST